MANAFGGKLDSEIGEQEVLRHRLGYRGEEYMLLFCSVSKR